MHPLLNQPEATYFGFTDVHGFKDFIGYVIFCAPDCFPSDDWRATDQQMTLERAFVGLQYGLDLAERETNGLQLVTECRKLVEEALLDYQSGRVVEGQSKLVKVKKLLEPV
jgi:hypothetical protein